MSETSCRLIETAQTVEPMAFSPDGDPLALVAISKSEALQLIALPVTALVAGQIGKVITFELR
ncbi:MAG: hypothetical protein RIS76_3039 [Verrucomicrobiota bacterium]|jgi:hypothetical protein